MKRSEWKGHEPPRYLSATKLKNKIQKSVYIGMITFNIIVQLLLYVRKQLFYSHYECAMTVSHCIKTSLVETETIKNM